MSERVFEVCSYDAWRPVNGRCRTMRKSLGGRSSAAISVLTRGNESARIGADRDLVSDSNHAPNDE